MTDVAQQENVVKRTVTVTGLGASVTVEVTGENLSIADALAKANVEINGTGLTVKRNGAPITDPANTEVNDGDQILATPPSTKLG